MSRKTEWPQFNLIQRWQTNISSCFSLFIMLYVGLHIQSWENPKSLFWNTYLVVGQTGAGAIRDNIEWFEYSHQWRKEIV